MASSTRDAIDTAPRVSIVIPAYNRERYLAATLDSVLAQTFPEWELVISDDGSTDGTSTVAQRYASADGRIRCINAANGGVAVARNRGLARIDSASEFVIMLDSDDVWEPDALTALIGALEGRPQCVAAHGLARCIDDDGKQWPNDDQERWMRARQAFRDGGLADLQPDEPTSFAALAVANWIVTPGTMLIRRQALDTVGELDPRTAPADDWDFALRLSRIGDFAFVDRVVLSWRRHPDAISFVSSGWRRAYFRVRDKLVADPTNTPAQARSARATYRAANRGAWNEAWTALRERRLATVPKRVGRAIEGEARYGICLGRTMVARGRASLRSPRRRPRRRC